LRTFKIYPLILILVVHCYSQTQTVIGPGLSGQDLWDFIYTNYKTTSTLGYTNARDTMYSVIDLHDDSLLTCVYTGFTIALNPSLDPSTDAFNKGVNCEHTWPQSMGADTEPQKSDMHHLFPCKDNVNSSRGNDPYAEIPDQDTEKWYRLDYYLTTIPTEYIDEYAEKENDTPQSFEPREDHKGDAARAMFYFYAIYRDVADTIFWNVQKDVLLQWHYADPVDLWEYNRSNQIGTYQDGIPNPFVLDSTLARRIWFYSESDVETKIIAHYMPWYQTLSVSGYWGWHWTMNHFNPNNIDDEGHREIASHYYPLTGPYDSQDDDILEYQVLLMKLSGIDGVAVDWYGIEDFYDYAINNQSTHALFNYIKLAELSFSICYEDQTIGHMVDGGHLNINDVYTHGQDVMLYMQDNWFTDDAYLKLSGQPVLLTFGPQYYHSSNEWDTLFSVLDVEPAFFTLNDQLGPVAVGAFPWPPMWASVGGVLSEAALNNYLSNFYQTAQSWEYLCASAFPAFYDIYQEAGLGFSYGYLDPQNGETFRNTLYTALENDPEIIQIVTWNDYGEGTIVEPTEEFGYQYLEIIQDVKRDSIDTTFPYTYSDLEIPLQLFELRKFFATDNEVNLLLDSVFALIVADDLVEAVTIIDSLNTVAGIDKNVNIPSKLTLNQNFPNPFNPVTTIQYQLPERSDVQITIFDLLGREVTMLVSETQEAGYKAVQWDAINDQGQQVGAGLYFFQIKAGSFVQTKKMILLK